MTTFETAFLKITFHNNCLPVTGSMKMTGTTL